MDPKIKSIIAHFTLLGWLVAYLINNENKDSFTTYYLKQSLGLNLAGIAISFIPVINFVLALGLLVLWILSLVSAAQGEIKETPLLGTHFQDWFKGI